MARAKLVLKALHIANWQSDDAYLNYSLIGLSEDGSVYRYRAADKVWYPLNMEIEEEQGLK